MHPPRRIVIALTWLLCVAGCASPSSVSPAKERASTAPLQTAALLKFSDVPIPVGFQLIDNESFTFQNELARVGLLKYVGRPTADRVVQFYLEQMPLYQWRFLNLLEYESRIINFEKPEQTCIVTVGKRGDRTQVTIAVAPKSGTARMGSQAQKNTGRSP